MVMQVFWKGSRIVAAKAHLSRYALISLVSFIFFAAGTGPVLAENLTLGLVQTRIKPGMSQGEVAQAIGSPNIASKNRDGNEVWIYDKISSETSTDEKKSGKSSGFTIGAILGPFGGFGGTKKGEEATKSKVTTTKKTLTVVIKFNKRSLVQNVTYHMSKF